MNIPYSFCCKSNAQFCFSQEHVLASKGVRCYERVSPLLVLYLQERQHLNYIIHSPRTLRPFWYAFARKRLTLFPYFKIPSFAPLSGGLVLLVDWAEQLLRLAAWRRQRWLIKFQRFIGEVLKYSTGPETFHFQRFGGSRSPLNRKFIIK